MRNLNRISGEILDHIRIHKGNSAFTDLYFSEDIKDKIVEQANVIPEGVDPYDKVKANARSFLIIARFCIDEALKCDLVSEGVTDIQLPVE